MVKNGSSRSSPSMHNRKCSHLCQSRIVIPALCLVALVVNCAIYAAYTSYSSPWKSDVVYDPTMNKPDNMRVLEALDRVFSTLKVEVARDPRIMEFVKVILMKGEYGLDSQEIMKTINQKLKLEGNGTLHPPIPVGQAGTLSQGRQQTQNKAVVTNQASPGDQCPSHPEGLIGALASVMEEKDIQYLENEFSTMTMGGTWKPTDCAPAQKLAVIIPYRNRWAHLRVLIRQLIPMLQRQRLDFTFFVIEQVPPSTFNRGMLMNVGFLEALKLADYTCFVFHDVDMLPLNDKNMYVCGDNPRHMPSGISKFRYGLPYPGYYGAVVTFSKEQYQRINGDSNLYFGWGGEDDDLLARVKAKGYKIVRTPVQLGKYDMIKHTRDKGNEDNRARFALLKTTTSRQNVEGLNTAGVYKVISTEKHKLFTWVKISLNATEVVQTAPADVRREIKNLIKETSTQLMSR